jgi:hypothetical protein
MSALVIPPSTATSSAATSSAATSIRARRDRRGTPPVGTVLVDRHLNGPRGFANGGFAAGSIAQHVDSDTVTVVLQRPVPLGRSLMVADDGDGRIVVQDRRKVVALARPGTLVDAAAPDAPSFAEAEVARSHHPLAGVRHLLSDCVVCGPRRVDGMHVTPGPIVGDGDRLAAPWTVTGAFAHAGLAWYTAVWAALDCTSYPAAALERGILCLLGTMTARVDRRPQVGEHLVVHSWTRHAHGRRFDTSVAMVDARGEEVARADATWIALAHQRTPAMVRWLR